MIELHNRIMASEADNGGAAKPLLLIQGESDGRRLTMTLLDGGTPLDLTAAAAVALYYTKPDGTEEQLPCTVEDAANGTVSVTFTSSSCAVAGDMRQVIIRITWSDASNSRYVGPRIHVAPSPSDDAVESSNEFALLDQLIIQAQEAIGDAGEAASAANTAAGAANDAKDAANTAASAANAAAGAANTAKDAAAAAAGTANAAASAANTAAGAANTAAAAANQAAEDAEAVLEGAVTSVNGKTGAVTLAAADVGALPATGGTMTGPLNAKDVAICDGTLYPSVDYKAEFSGDIKAQVLANMERNIVYFRNWCTDNTGFHENYLTPDPDTGRTSNGNYKLLTTKETADYVAAQGTSGGWAYRKWNSGIAECWLAGSTSLIYDNVANNLYRGYGAVTFPFTFYTRPVVVYSCYLTNGYDWSGKAVVSTSSFSFYGVSQSSLASTTSVTIYAYAIGRWK